jgi:hypothetical protein
MRPLYQQPSENHYQVPDAAGTRLLLKAGAAREVADEGRDTPLHVAARYGHTDVLRLLLTAGVDVTRRNHGGDTAAQVAKENDRREALALLRRHQEEAGIPDMPEPPRPTLVRAHPQKAEAVTLGRHGTLTRWTLEDRQPRVATHMETDHPRLVDLAITPDGTGFVILTADNVIEFRRWDDLGLVRAVPSPLDSDYGLEALALSPDGRWLAVAGGAEEVHLVDTATGESVTKIDGGSAPGRSASARTPGCSPPPVPSRAARTSALTVWKPAAR